MQYILDTDICIYIIKKKPQQLLLKLMRHDISTIGISSITLSELEYGVEKSSYPQQSKAALNEFISALTVLPYDDNVAPLYGKVRAYLEKEGMKIGSLDTLIGAHALSLKAVLVTNNDREFDRIPNLKVENWLV